MGLQQIGDIHFLVSYCLRCIVYAEISISTVLQEFFALTPMTSLETE